MKEDCRDQVIQTLSIKTKAQTCLLLMFMTACALPGSDSTDAEEDGGEQMPRTTIVTSAGWLPSNRTQRCKLPPAPPLGEMELVSVLDANTLERPIWVNAAPTGDGTIWVVEQGGRIIESTLDGVSRTILDLTVSRAGNEEGLLGLAPHPNFSQNGYVYLYYSAAQPRRSVISRYSYRASDRTFDPNSEYELLSVEQPFGNHNGGDLHFGPDGFLYISLGDGGGAGDPYGYSQNTTSLLGSVLRVNVDVPDPSCMKAYSIPADNPFVDSGCGNGSDEDRPEIWAWGLRNVWRMSFDSGTGQLWGADVGQDRKEEVNILEGGLNYGWNPVEADICYQSGCITDAYAPPVYSYPHDQGESVTGGLVYRGNQLPELWGQYVFGDYESGRIWSLDETQTANLLVESRRKITSFGVGPNGELLVASFNGGIEQMNRANPDPNLPEFPQKLSQTGCTSISTTDAQNANLLPYFVNYPFWSDGVSKSRYVSLPETGEIQFTGATPASFPVGTVIVKNFYLEGAARPFPIETRLIHREEAYWSSFSYRWDVTGTDADLVNVGTNVPLNYQGRSIEWQFMARSQCDKCHIQAQGYALGLSLEQLQRPVEYPTGVEDQVNAWLANGFASRSGESPSPFPEPADAMTPTELNEQVRVYLDVNCASCHQPNGPGDAEIDLRRATPFRDMGLCNVQSDRDYVDTQDGYLLKPGNPSESIIYQRVNRRDDQKMPPIGSNEIDEAGVELIKTWIESMTDCNTLEQ